jgi:hypothetical protein
MIFQAPCVHADVVGRVSRLCLSSGVVPAFFVPHEFGSQSTIEDFKGTGQEKVWARFVHGSPRDLQGNSQSYVTTLRRHCSNRIESAPRDVPSRTDGNWNFCLDPGSQIIYLERTNALGTVEVLVRS